MRMSKASGARAWGGLVRMDDCIRSNVPNQSIRSAHTLFHLCFEAPLRRRSQVVYGHGGSQRESCRYFLFTSSGLAVSVKSKISYGLRAPSAWTFCWRYLQRNRQETYFSLKATNIRSTSSSRWNAEASRLSSFSSSASEIETSGFGVLEDEDASADMLKNGQGGEGRSQRRSTNQVALPCHSAARTFIWCYL